MIQNTSANQMWDVEVQSYNNEGDGPRCPIAKAQSGNEGNVLIAECFCGFLKIEKYACPFPETWLDNVSWFVHL